MSENNRSNSLDASDSESNAPFYLLDTFDMSTDSSDTLDAPETLAVTGTADIQNMEQVVESSSDDDQPGVGPIHRQVRGIANRRRVPIYFSVRSRRVEVFVNEQFRQFVNHQRNLKKLRQGNIEQIPSAIISQENLDDNLQCSICLENFTLGENVKKLICGHLFHGVCILPWLKQYDSCPICREVVFPFPDTTPGARSGNHLNLNIPD